MKRSDLSAEIRKKWRPRPRQSHKGDFGRVLIVAGSKGMHGAAHLAATAALRTGAGLVTLAVPEKIYSVIARREAEVMVRSAPSTRLGTLSEQALKPIGTWLQNQDVLAIGPGLSRHPQTIKLVRKLVKKVQCFAVIDADALNAFEGEAELFQVLAGRAMLTPHEGEYYRLFGRRPAKDKQGRIQAACFAARASGVCIVLKGFQTVVADPSGKFYVNTTGNAGMATAGTGDVLTGMAAAILAQGLSVYDSACFAVYLHGRAGDLAARRQGEVSMIASDIILALPEILKRLVRRA